jgi:L-fucose mutarotase
VPAIWRPRFSWKFLQKEIRPTMLLSELIHPQILEVLGGAGHGATVLIADGNYPASTFVGSRARLIPLNLAPGIVGCVDVLNTLLTAIPVERAQVMDPGSGEKPSIWAQFEKAFMRANVPLALEPVPRFDFYRIASTDQHALTILTAEQRTYANVLLTIGVRAAVAR